MKYFIPLLLLTVALFGCKNKKASYIDRVSAAGIGTNDTDADSGASIIAETNAAGEMAEYMGVKLGSVNDFRENSIKGVQYVDVDDYTLTIDGLVDNELELTYDELTDMDHETKLITIYCVEGWEVTILWEGIPLNALFELAQPTIEANNVIFHAADGYTTHITLEYIYTNDLMIADKANGITLPAHLGFPLILVAEDKWGYKWARWITRIELSSDEDYEGFWEKRGYSSTADLDEYFWDGR